jgi:hypothetical protein
LPLPPNLLIRPPSQLENLDDGLIMQRVAIPTEEPPISSHWARTWELC